MEIYYFTYGGDDGGGWTKVVADDYDRAVEAFCLYHPRRDGFVACASIYSVEQFKRTKMFSEGNFGRRCIETITLTRTVMAP